MPHQSNLSMDKETKCLIRSLYYENAALQKILLNANNIIYAFQESSSSLLQETQTLRTSVKKLILLQQEAPGPQQSKRSPTAPIPRYLWGHATILTVLVYSLVLRQLLAAAVSHSSALFASLATTLL